MILFAPLVLPTRRLAALVLIFETLQDGASLIHSRLRPVAGGDAIKNERRERRQRAAVERGDEGGAPCVGDLGGAEVE